MDTLDPGWLRLEQPGFARARWGITENKRKARFYEITAAGRRQPGTERAERDRTVSIMHTLLNESR